MSQIYFFIDEKSSWKFRDGFLVVLCLDEHEKYERNGFRVKLLLRTCRLTKILSTNLLQTYFNVLVSTVNKVHKVSAIQWCILRHAETAKILQCIRCLRERECLIFRHASISGRGYVIQITNFWQLLALTTVVSFLNTGKTCTRVWIGNKCKLM